jgi:alpha-beta hydrolase superfamily lysophospholipase
MQETYFDAADGLRLFARWQPAPSAQPRGAALVVHGYADHAGRYAEVARRLTDHGFHTMAFDYRGHGQAAGQRGHCDRFAEYLADLDRALRTLRARAGDLPVLIVAHSHGSLITLRALTDPGQPLGGVRAAVLSSPFLAIGMKVNPVKLLAGKAASRIAPRFSMPNGIDTDLLTHDAEILKVTKLDGLRHTVATARWFTEMQEAQRFVEEHAGRIKLPTLWLVGTGDRIADPGAMQRVYARAGGDKHLAVFDGFYHELFNETERARVFAALDPWILSRFPGLT